MYSIFISRINWIKLTKHYFYISRVLIILFIVECFFICNRINRIYIAVIGYYTIIDLGFTNS